MKKRLSINSALIAQSGAFTQYAQSLNQSIGLDKDVYTLGGIISKILPISITLGGLALFVMLILGGFKMMTSVSDPKGAEAGKKQLTSAITGFILLFLVYWIVRIFEIVLGINIL